MKRFSILAVFVFFAVRVIAQVEQPLDSRIMAVKVFRGQAQVTRTGRTRIDAGKTDIVFRGLTAQLDGGSIQVSGRGNFIILGISHRQNFLEERALPRTVRMLEDSVAALEQQLWLEQNQKAILINEELLIQNNQKSEAKESLSVTDLKAMADFYRMRLQETALLRVKQDNRIKALNIRLGRLRGQIQEQKDLYTRHTSEIVVHVSADAACTADLDAQYITGNAGWTPLYDLRARDTKSPVELSYKANVYQRTGEDWKDVQLTLSTSNPTLGGLKPELSPWYLSIYKPMPVEAYGSYEMKDAKAEAAVPVAESVAGKVSGVEIDDSETVANYVHTVQTALHAEFVIGLPYSVVSSTKPTLVDIRQHSLPADYLYSVAPKLDADAFLMARITGWEGYDLLPGEASVFFEGTFVGRTAIDPNVVNDTLSLSLGRDKRIVVKREQNKDVTSVAMIGSRRRNTYGYTISVRNAKADAIRIVVEDQVPVSQDTQIEVSLSNVGGAHREEATGKLTWELLMKPGEAKKIVYGYEVKFPKGKVVEGV